MLGSFLDSIQNLIFVIILLNIIFKRYHHIKHWKQFENIKLGLVFLSKHFLPKLRNITAIFIFRL